MVNCSPPCARWRQVQGAPQRRIGGALRNANSGRSSPLSAQAGILRPLLTGVAGFEKRCKRATLSSPARLRRRGWNRCRTVTRLYVGQNAFAIKAGASTPRRSSSDPKTYEHVISARERRYNRCQCAGLRSAGKSELSSPSSPAASRPIAPIRARDKLLAEVEGARGAASPTRPFADASLRASGSPHARHRAALFRRAVVPRSAVERRFNAIGELITLSEG